MENKEVLRDYFKQYSDKDKKLVDDTVSAASDVSGFVELTVPGFYLMEVNNIAYKKDGKTKIYPNLSTTGKGQMMLNFNLSVIDGTKQVPKGASIFTAFVITAPPKAPAEAVAKVANFMKPRLSALLNDGITLDMTNFDWIDENLLPQYEEDENGIFKLVRDHNMKSRVMVLIEEGEYDGRIKCEVKMIRKAHESDCSSSHVVEVVPTKQNVALPQEDEVPVKKISERVQDFNPDPLLEDELSREDS